VINGKLSVSLLEKARLALHRSKGLHLWNEMWRLNGVEKNARFPKFCIYESLKERYLNALKTYEINVDGNVL
jgi:hypothetical protein